MEEFNKKIYKPATQKAHMLAAYRQNTKKNPRRLNTVGYGAMCECGEE